MSNYLSGSTILNGPIYLPFVIKMLASILKKLVIPEALTEIGLSVFRGFFGKMESFHME